MFIPEATRNGLLRRVDWRFLLANPLPTRSICFSPGELTDALALISASTVGPAANRDADCDLAVATDPDDAMLSRAHHALRAGGALYCEWHGALRRPGLQHLRTRLEAAGFESIGFFLPQPGPARARADHWAPLEAPGVLAFAARVRDPAKTWRGRFARALADRWRAGTRFRYVHPVCAIAVKSVISTDAPRPADAAVHARTRTQAGPPASEAEAALQPRTLQEMIHARWHAWRLGPVPTRVAPLLLTWGASSVNKVIALAFADSEPEPRLVIKQPRVPDSLPGLAREAAMLRTLEQRGVTSVPRVVFWDAAARAPRLGLNAIPGRRLHEILTPRNARDFALRATDWQVHLARQTMSPPGSDWRSRMVEPVLAEFVEHYGAAVDSGLLRETEQILAALNSLPVVCEQRDFAPWNLLVDAQGNLNVLDWEWSREEGVPAIDLVHGMAYFAIYLQNAHATGRYLEAYQSILGTSTRFGEAAQECFAIYSERIGLRPGDLRPLRVLTWLLHALPEYQLLAAAAGGSPAPERLRNTVFLRMWDAELRCGT